MWNKKKKKVTKQMIVEKAMNDDVYRQKLKAHPHETIKEYFDITVPPNFELVVVEETPNRFYLVIPQFHNEDDMNLPCGDDVNGTW
jgi:hypothetical protein